MNPFKHPTYKWLIIASLNFGLAAGFWSIKGQSTIESDVIDLRLNEIKTQIQTLQTEVKKSHNPIELGTFNQDFNKLTALIEQLKSKDESGLNQLINENRTELNHKLDDIHQVINTLNKKQNPIKYLPVTALSFKIISIDSIQQVSVATVSYDYKTIPLEKSDSLAGWTVLSVDYGTQQLELENNKKERVKVTLKDDQHA
jgi:vacuolar-type H+-ATPase subunit I/STV1